MKKIITFIFIGSVLYLTYMFFLNNIDEKYYLNEKENNDTFRNIYNTLAVDKISISKKEVEEKSTLKVNRTPLYYIYNTHQTEEYGRDLYYLNPTVISLSYMINDRLNELGKYGIVEERDVLEEVKKIGGDYKYTYDVTWNFMNEISENNKSIKYFFDIHRDGVSKDISTASINNKSYAKIMFLSGERHSKYKENLKNISIMEKYLNEKYPGILRNTYHQSKYSYNQEFSSFTFLIEVGGEYNSIEEVYNSSIALGDAINYLIEETYEK